MTSWSDHAIWWHVYPLGFTGAETVALPAGSAPAPRLGHLQSWLDYAIELGCSGLALGPVFASETHGYDTVDHFRIDPRLGDDKDFDRLVDAAGQRGLHILLDGVFNHVGRGFARFQDALRGGPGSPAANWFRMRWPAATGSGGSGGSAEPDYDCFEGHRHLVTLNHDAPAVADYVTEVMCHWLDRGVAGWRLDAAYAVPSRFWRQVLPRARARHPRAWFVGEVIHGDYTGYVTDGDMDSVTQYELWKAIWSSLNDRNLFELAWALDRHNGLASVFAPLTFVGNHDVTRVASLLTDPRYLGHALAVLFTVAGTPSIYYGDEQGFRGIKEDRSGGDDAVRPTFPAEPAGLAPWGLPTYRLHQELIGLRRRHPWLTRCDSTTLHLTNEQIALRCTPRRNERPTQQVGEAPTEAARTSAASVATSAEVILLLNLADHPYDFPITTAARVEAADEASRLSEPACRLAARGWAVLTR